MRIAVPHHTSKVVARRKLEERLGQLLGQFGSRADELEHDWSGDTLSFKGKAKGLKVEGTVDVTDTEIVLHAKLPFMAIPFEGKIRHAVEKEADTMFRTA